MGISSSSLYVPAGPIMAPRPGPTFEMAEPAPESAVTVSTPAMVSAMADMANDNKNKKLHYQLHRVENKIKNNTDMTGPIDTTQKYRC